MPPKELKEIVIINFPEQEKKDLQIEFIIERFLNGHSDYKIFIDLDIQN